MSLQTDDEYTWITPPLTRTPLTSSLVDLESSLRCPICHSLYHIPVSVHPCGHTFCSECIRVSLRESRKTNRKEICPQCRVSTDERELRPNRGLEGVVRRWVDVRFCLKERLLEGGGGGNGGGNGGEKRRLELNEEKKEEQQQQPPATKRPRRNCTTTTTARPRRHHQPNPLLSNSDASNSSSSSYSQNADEEGSTTEKDDDESDTNQTYKVDESILNNCSSTTSTTNNQIRRKATPHYHSMKRKQIADMCAREGLPTTGTEGELKKRHQEFITLYHSECDSEFPRSQEELVKEVMRRERAKKVEATAKRFGGPRTDSLNLERLKQSRKRVGEDGGGKVTSKDPEFDRKLKDGFREMIQDYRQREKKGNETDDHHNEKEEQSSVVNGEDSKPAAMKDDTTSLVLEETVPSHEATSISTCSSISNPYKTKSKLDGTTIASSSLQALPKQRKKRSTPKTTGPWVCPRCTYINDKRTWSNASCEMCNSRRPCFNKRNNANNFVEVDC